MIEHVYRRAAAVPSVGRVIVATDDERIVQAVERFGGEARMTSPAHASGSDRIAEVARDLTCDVVVNVQGDEPLIDPLVIEEAIAPLSADPNLQVSTLRRRISDAAELQDPNVVKVVVDRDGFALYFSRSSVPYFRTTAGKGPAVAARDVSPAYKHIGLYVYRRRFLLRFAGLERTPLERAESLEQLRALEHGYRIKTVEIVHDSVGVDTEEDLQRVRRLVEIPSP